jgi:hypothetical protein
MTEDNPITTAFELQRRTIEQGQKTLEQSLEFQKQLNDAVTAVSKGGPVHKNRASNSPRTQSTTIST